MVEINQSFSYILNYNKFSKIIENMHVKPNENIICEVYENIDNISKVLFDKFILDIVYFDIIDLYNQLIDIYRYNETDNMIVRIYKENKI